MKNFKLNFAVFQTTPMYYDQIKKSLFKNINIQFIQTPFISDALCDHN